MGFVLGDRVRVKPLKKDGVITDFASGRRYRVQIGGVSVLCKESDLLASRFDSKQHRMQGQVTGASPSGITVSKEVRRLQQQQKRLRKLQSLDLHGKTVAEALELLDSFLNDAVLAGYENAEVVHGIGTGALKKAVHQRLATVATVAQFRIKQDNPGTTLVFFR